MLAHSKVFTLFSTLLVALAVGAAATPAAQEQSAPFEGVWRTLEVVIPGAAGGTFRPESTLAIFHGRHYSRTEVHAEQPRPLLADSSAASADQLRAVWGPFVGEAGTFELSGNNLITMQATVAKNPAAMTKGAVSVLNYRRDGSILTLTQVRTHAGPSPNAATIKLTRVE